MLTTLKWDALQDRTYERGVDRVVLYLDDGEAVTWSGVVAINERKTNSSEAVYFDGNKLNAVTQTDSYAGTIQAITYPEVVSILEGSEEINHGIYLTNQHPRPFNMSYRTGVGSALGGAFANSKIHIVLGLLLMPSDKASTTMNEDPSASTFDWELVAIPPSVGNYRPTSHIILDEAAMPNTFRDELYLALYGDGTNPPEFDNIEELVQTILSYSFWKIDDNGDKTFDATPFNDEDLTQINPAALAGAVDYELYQLDNVDLEKIDDDTYLIVNGYGTSNACTPRVVGSIGIGGSNGGCYHMVRSAIASDALSHYIGTAPLLSQETQPVWKVTEIYFGPPSSITIKKNIRWTERESA